MGRLASLSKAAGDASLFCNVIVEGLRTRVGRVLISSLGRQEDLPKGSDKMADKDPEETARLAAIEQCSDPLSPQLLFGPSLLPRRG